MLRLILKSKATNLSCLYRRNQKCPVQFADTNSWSAGINVEKAMCFHKGRLALKACRE
jgi:hypothetical protein